MKEKYFLTQQQLQEYETQYLASYAMLAGQSKRRFRIPDEGREYKFRTEFQRDRDRIVHSRSFRRLKHKTQVYAPYDGDHQRTRLTHTIEVSQISRTIARALRLNEDLAEAVSLGHDLGHTPFGHSGEKILDRIMTGSDDADCLDTKLMKNAGGFKHNFQSLRIVDMLEKRYDHDGINLTYETREGILKHTKWENAKTYPDLFEEGLNLDQPVHFEGQVVEAADEIAQVSHDLEDGLLSREVELEKVEKLTIGELVIKHLEGRYKETGSNFLKQNMMIRGIIHLLVTNIVMSSGQRLADWVMKNDIKTSDDFYNKREKIEEQTIWFNDEGNRLYLELQNFVKKWIINSYSVNRADGRARYFLRKLFAAYYTNPFQLESYVLIRMRDKAKVPYLRDIDVDEQEQELKKHYHNNPVFIRLICDHIAGMSDAYALREFEKLFIPYQLSTTAIK
jgi:dGTPase